MDLFIDDIAPDGARLANKCERSLCFDFSGCILPDNIDPICG